MRRRALMDLIFGGDDMVKYGYFEVEPEKASETWQVNTDDYTIEVQTGLNATPKKIVCVYIDDKERLTVNGVAIFSGNTSGNGYSITANTSSHGRAESVSFLSPDALYTRYDESTATLYLHILQWQLIKCGKWMWIAIYDE